MLRVQIQVVPLKWSSVQALLDQGLTVLSSLCLCLSLALLLQHLSKCPLFPTTDRLHLHGRRSQPRMPPVLAGDPGYGGGGGSISLPGEDIQVLVTLWIRKWSPDCPSVRVGLRIGDRMLTRFQKVLHRDLPGGPLVKTLCFHYRGLRFHF